MNKKWYISGLLGLSILGSVNTASAMFIKVAGQPVDVMKVIALVKTLNKEIEGVADVSKTTFQKIEQHFGDIADAAPKLVASIEAARKSATAENQNKVLENLRALIKAVYPILEPLRNALKRSLALANSATPKIMPVLPLDENVKEQVQIVIDKIIEIADQIIEGSTQIRPIVDEIIEYFGSVRINMDVKGIRDVVEKQLFN